MKKYLAYSVGEIALVTIGILLAIQANNFNESQKEKRSINEIYARISSDIDRNIQSAEEFLANYKEMEYLYEKVLNDSIHPDHLGQGLPFLITGLIKYEYDQTGVTQLKNKSLSSPSALELIKIYESAQINFLAYTEAIEQNVQDNLTNWRDQYPWFQAYVNNQLTDEAVNYFLNNQDYKNRVAYFYLAVYGGYIPSVEEFIVALENWKAGYAHQG
ncbi:MAG: hypothetical protein AAF598_06195 [Bacteroidota bacterium]